MEHRKLNWETEFITAENLMIHTFSDRVKVATNIKTGEIKTLRDGEIISSRNDMPISEYEKFLIAVAEDATKLQNFTL
jgi:hypothetical protein